MANRGGGWAFVALAVVCTVLVLAPQCAARKALVPQGTAEKPLVPAMFVFGDSLVDVGNNNHLDNCSFICKANYPRYGVDLPCHLPTGRFSNGYNLADQLAQLLGFGESPPAFLNLSSASVLERMSTGINFASGGSGLLPTTGNQTVFTMAEQVGNFTSLVRRSSKISKCRTVAGLIPKSLILISAGSNDLFEYADHFAQPNVSDPSRNDTQFLQGLVASYTGYVRDLHAAGARRFSVLSPSLVGCCPLQRSIANRSKDVDKFGCLGVANNLSRQLYPMIASMLQGLSRELPGMSYSLGDGIGIGEFVFNSSSSSPDYSFTLDHACCGAGDFGESGCNGSVPLCPDRSRYFFWDRFHPTDAASAITATVLYGGEAGGFVHPVNVQQLVAPPPP